jgi:hypothetical protein
MPATGWINHDAAVFVARQTKLAKTERHQLLDMLGVEDPDTGYIKADPTGATPWVASTVQGATCGLDNSPNTARSRKVTEPPPSNGAFCPPGLRALFEGGEPVREPWQIEADEAVKAAARPVGPKAPVRARRRSPNGTHKPRPSRAVPKEEHKKRVWPEPECGTEAGYRKHLKRHEEIDAPCHAAWREADNRRAKARRDRGYVAPGGKRKVAQCGTPGGYARHRREGTEQCRPCLDAHVADNDARDARKAQREQAA